VACGSACGCSPCHGSKDTKRAGHAAGCVAPFGSFATCAPSKGHRGVQPGCSIIIPESARGSRSNYVVWAHFAQSAVGVLIPGEHGRDALLRLLGRVLPELATHAASEDAAKSPEATASGTEPAEPASSSHALMPEDLGVAPGKFLDGDLGGGGRGKGGGGGGGEEEDLEDPCPPCYCIWTWESWWEWFLSGWEFHDGVWWHDGVARLSPWDVFGSTDQLFTIAAARASASGMASAEARRRFELTAAIANLEAAARVQPPLADATSVPLDIESTFASDRTFLTQPTRLLPAPVESMSLVVVETMDVHGLRSLVEGGPIGGAGPEGLAMGADVQPGGLSFGSGDRPGPAAFSGSPLASVGQLGLGLAGAAAQGAASVALGTGTMATAATKSAASFPTPGAAGSFVASPSPPGGNPGGGGGGSAPGPASGLSPSGIGAGPGSGGGGSGGSGGAGGASGSAGGSGGGGGASGGGGGSGSGGSGGSGGAAGAGGSGGGPGSGGGLPSGGPTGGFPMRGPADRACACSACGAAIVAGRRGPLPTRCARCRRAVLPGRVAGRVACSLCARGIRVGRRGPLPTRCSACRRPSAPERRAGVGACARCGLAIAVPAQTGRVPRRCWWCRQGRRRLEDLTAADWAALEAARVEVAP
jgi:hypothetical protein